MKKFLTIGRDSQCDICIVDKSDVVSRQHAILEIGGGGKYYITDKSRNGTYVNGIKIAANERVPVTRKDIISLAHIQELDWNQVPKNNTLIYGIIAVGVLVVVAVVLLLTLNPSNISNDFVGGTGGGTSNVDQTEELIPDTQENPTTNATDDQENNKSADEQKTKGSKVSQTPADKKQSPSTQKSIKVIDAIY